MQLQMKVFVYELARTGYFVHSPCRDPQLSGFVWAQRLHGLLTHGACLLETDQLQICTRESVTCLPRIVMLYTYTRGWNLDRQVTAWVKPVPQFTEDLKWLMLAMNLAALEVTEISYDRTLEARLF